MDYWLSKMSLNQAPVFVDELGKSNPELVDKLGIGDTNKLLHYIYFSHIFRLTHDLLVQFSN